MTILTHHPSHRIEPDSHHWGRRIPTTTAALASLKLVCLRALGPLLIGGALAGIIALKTAIALSHIGH